MLGAGWHAFMARHRVVSAFEQLSELLLAIGKKIFQFRLNSIRTQDEPEHAARRLKFDFIGHARTARNLFKAMGVDPLLEEALDLLIHEQAVRLECGDFADDS